VDMTGMDDKHPSSTKEQANAAIAELEKKLPDSQNPLWPHVTKKDFIENLRSIVNTPTSINQGKTEFCGPAAAAIVFFHFDPKGMVLAMAKLYQTGTFSYNTGDGVEEFTPSKAVREYIGGTTGFYTTNTEHQWDNRKYPMSKVAGMLLYGISDTFKGVSNWGSFSPGDEENSSFGGTSFGKEKDIFSSFGFNINTMGGNLGFSGIVSDFELFYDNGAATASIITDALKKGDDVILFELPAIFEDGGTSYSVYGHHYIKVESLKYDKKSDEYQLKIIDYGTDHPLNIKPYNFLHGLFGIIDVPKN